MEEVNRLLSAVVDPVVAQDAERLRGIYVAINMAMRQAEVHAQIAHVGALIDTSGFTDTESAEGWTEVLSRDNDAKAFSS